jgi:hypothetical protein
MPAHLTASRLLLAGFVLLLALVQLGLAIPGILLGLVGLLAAVMLLAP